MNNKLKKGLFWLSILVTCSIVMNLAINVLYSLDDNTEHIERYLYNNEKVIVEVGNIQSLSLQRIVTFNGDKDTNAYKDYMYSVKGKEANILINIRVQDSCDITDERCIKIIE